MSECFYSLNINIHKNKHHHKTIFQHIIGTLLHVLQSLSTLFCYKLQYCRYHSIKWLLRQLKTQGNCFHDKFNKQNRQWRQGRGKRAIPFPIFLAKKLVRSIQTTNDLSILAQNPGPNIFTHTHLQKFQMAAVRKMCNILINL